jgi:hypothetical protein
VRNVFCKKWITFKTIQNYGKGKRRMAIKSYKVELTTAIAITLNNDEHTANNLWEVIVGKAQEQINDQNLNDKKYVLKVVSEVTERE